MTHYVVIIDIIVKTRVNAVHEAAVVLYLINEEGRGIFNEHCRVILVYGIDFPPAVLCVITDKFKYLAVFIAQPAYTSENNIFIGQGGDGSAPLFFKISFEIG